MAEYAPLAANRIRRIDVLHGEHLAGQDMIEAQYAVDRPRAIAIGNLSRSILANANFRPKNGRDRRAHYASSMVEGGKNWIDRDGRAWPGVGVLIQRMGSTDNIRSLLIRCGREPSDFHFAYEEVDSIQEGYAIRGHSLALCNQLAWAAVFELNADVSTGCYRIFQSESWIRQPNLWSPSDWQDNLQEFVNETQSVRGA